MICLSQHVWLDCFALSVCYSLYSEDALRTGDSDVQILDLDRCSPFF
jgi:hypothetical protein